VIKPLTPYRGEAYEEISKMWQSHENRLKELQRADYDVVKQNHEAGYRRCLLDLMERGIGPYMLW